MKKDNEKQKQQREEDVWRSAFDYAQEHATELQDSPKELPDLILFTDCSPLRLLEEGEELVAA